MADTLHPIVALWRTIGKDMTVAQFRAWYWEQSEADLSQLAELAAEDLRRGSDSKAVVKSGSDT